jgi:hypothetical protein
MKGRARYFFHLLSKRYRRLISLAYSRLYRDNNRDISRSILVAGAARSGTTWLADIIASQIPSRIMFEPFHPKLVCQYQGFNYYQYMRPEVENLELYHYVYKIFSGDIRDPWIDKHVGHIYPKKRVIKAVRINLMAKWLNNKFPNVPQVFVIRHPCAVVLSRMQLNWGTDTDIEPLLSQPNLVEDFLSNKIEIFERANTDEEKHAIIWCISNLIPLRQFQPGTLNITFYENMCTQPEIEIPYMFKSIGIEYRESIYKQVIKPSTTSMATSAVLTGENKISNWKKKLSTTQIDNTLKIVENFGLDHIYGSSVVPLIS